MEQEGVGGPRFYQVIEAVCGLSRRKRGGGGGRRLERSPKTAPYPVT